MPTSIAEASDHKVRSAVVADHVVSSGDPGLPVGTVQQASRIPQVASATGALRRDPLPVRNASASATALGVPTT
ncbi:hypothetical protein ACSNOK_31045 [Streptomyces sp. URMC 126]|uniref:hypothetical protein n=1 Tax=Streptomyces sp. URMC 126 TaxID=3423401 RepID=UPI003F1DEF7D